MEDSTGLRTIHEDVGSECGSLTSFESTGSSVSVDESSVGAFLAACSPELARVTGELNTVLKVIPTKEGVVDSDLSTNQNMKAFEQARELQVLSTLQAQDIGKLEASLASIKKMDLPTVPPGILKTKVNGLMSAVKQREGRLRTLMESMECIHCLDKGKQNDSTQDLTGQSQPSVRELPCGLTNNFHDDNGWNSRRVVLNNLPTGVSLTQIFDGVSGQGGIASVQILNTGTLSTPGSRSAVVEFNEPGGARDYCIASKKKPIFFQNECLLFQQVDVQIIWTASYMTKAASACVFPADAKDYRGCRCVELTKFPEGAIFNTLKTIGLQNIVRVSFEGSMTKPTGQLCIEVSSVFHSQRLRHLVQRGKILGYVWALDHMLPEGTPSDQPAESLWPRVENGVPFVDHGYLEWVFNRKPYNLITTLPVLSTEASVLSAAAFRTLANATLPTRPIWVWFGFDFHVDPDDASYGSLEDPSEESPEDPSEESPEDPSEESPEDPSEEPLADLAAPVRLNTRVEVTEEIAFTIHHELDGIVYLSLDGRILIRDPKAIDGFSLVESRDLEDLQGRTMFSHEWEALWQKWAYLNDERNWKAIAYGKLARHRRQRNDELGNPHWVVPDCSDCPCPYQDLKHSPTPQEILSYISSGTRDIVDTN
ncbi:hypothetical protein FZEAL_1987 [Fusarium zealandicum]|uniref:Uncharacterized protein n=1 Tax=Fusarium zealandicum TaxID=1053134 RepID=A0A8H4XPD2_9HYPO|nr:hypothetical protein FZEAL_1987 [Fusarium zealandicum]